MDLVKTYACLKFSNSNKKCFQKEKVRKSNEKHGVLIS